MVRSSASMTLQGSGCSGDIPWTLWHAIRDESALPASSRCFPSLAVLADRGIREIAKVLETALCSTLPVPSRLFPLPSVCNSAG
jgi:hypothetical protein